MIFNLYIALSWFFRLLTAGITIHWLCQLIAPRSSLNFWLERVLAPALAPFRRLARLAIIRWGARFDCTYILAIIGINIIERIVSNILFRLMY